MTTDKRESWFVGDTIILHFFSLLNAVVLAFSDKSCSYNICNYNEGLKKDKFLFKKAFIMGTDPVCCLSFSPEWPQENTHEIILSCCFITKRIHRKLEMEMVEIFLIRHS